MLAELLNGARVWATSMAFAAEASPMRRRLLSSYLIADIGENVQMRRFWTALGLPLTVLPSSYLPSSFTATRAANHRLDVQQSWYHQPPQVDALLAELNTRRGQLPLDGPKYRQRYHIQPVEHLGTVKGGHIHPHEAELRGGR